MASSSRIPPSAECHSSEESNRNYTQSTVSSILSSDSESKKRRPKPLARRHKVRKIKKLDDRDNILGGYNRDDVLREPGTQAKDLMRGRLLT